MLSREFRVPKTSLRASIYRRWKIYLVIVAVVAVWWFWPSQQTKHGDPPSIELASDLNFLPEHISPFISTPMLQNLSWKQVYYLCWTTAPQTWTDRHDLVLQSIFRHQPDARVFMITTSITDDFFERYRELGYAISALQISPQQMLTEHWFVGEHSQQFLLNWEQHSAGRYFYSHMTDFLRMTLLTHSGGTYMDMDALVLRPLPEQEFIGMDVADFFGRCKWGCWSLSDYRELSGEEFFDPNTRQPIIPPKVRHNLDIHPRFYIAPGFMRLRPGHAFLRYALENFFRAEVYQSDCFNCVGPVALTRSYQKWLQQLVPQQKSPVHLLPWYQLYPYNYENILQTFQTMQNSTVVAQQLEDSSLSLHLFGHVSSNKFYEVGSAAALVAARIGGFVCRPTLSLPDVYVHQPDTKHGTFVGRDAIRVSGTAQMRHHVTVTAQRGVLSNGGVVLEGTMAAVNLELSRLVYELSPNHVEEGGVVDVGSVYGSVGELIDTIIIKHRTDVSETEVRLEVINGDK